MFNEGISKIGEILDFAVATEVIKKSGSFFSYGDTKLGQGRDNVKNVLTENPDLCDEIEAKINEKIKESGLEAVLNKMGKKSGE
jgi:recombination protein RecA